MAYPRKLLGENETIIIDARPHWKALIGPVLASLLGIGLAVLAWWWMDSVQWSDGVETGVGVAAGVVVAVLIAWLAVAPYIRWATTHFVVTDRRVIYRTGVFTKSGIDIPLMRVNSVQFRHGFIDQLLRTGTLIIESASDDPLEFDDIPQVEKVHMRLYQEVHERLSDNDDEDRRPLPPTGGSQDTPPETPPQAPIPPTA